MPREYRQMKQTYKTIGFLQMLVTSMLAMPYSAFANHEETDLPTSTEAVVPELKYQSVFSDYSIFKDEEVASWQQLNQQVKGGGHAGHSMNGQHSMPHQSTPENDMPSMDHSNTHHHH